MKQQTFFLLNLALFAVLTCLYLLFTHYRADEYNPVIPGIFVAYLIMNQFFLKMLQKSHKRSPRRFVSAFLGVVGIKLMSSMVFLLIYLMAVSVDDAINVTISLFIAYMSFTILLVRAALKTGDKTTGNQS